MNGRCETDPLDQAVDVCDSCYGEFCHACLVRPKGRRHPVCTDCALIASGVRTGVQPEHQGSRRSARKRRAALKNKATEETAVFEYFDAETTGTAAGSGTDVDSQRGRPETADEAETTSSAAVEPSSEALEPMDDAASSTESSTTSYPAEDGAAAGESANAMAEDEPTTPAVARLNQIRQNAEQKRSADQSAGPELEEAAGLDPAAELNPASPAGAGPDAGLDSRAPLPETEVAKSTVVREPDPSNTVEESRPARKPRPTAASSRRRRTDRVHGDGTRQATAPMIGEVRVIGGRRSSDVGQREPDPSTDPVTAEAASVSGSEARNAVDQFDAGDTQAKAAASAFGSESGGGPSSEDEGSAVATSARKADTDASGNWIPPILRGMAPDVREAKASLPQRHKRDED